MTEWNLQINIPGPDGEDDWQDVGFLKGGVQFTPEEGDDETVWDHPVWEVPVRTMIVLVPTFRLRGEAEDMVYRGEIAEDVMWEETIENPKGNSDEIIRVWEPLEQEK